MDQEQARQVARVLNTAGFAVVVNEQGGWTAQTVTYDSVRQMPRLWQDILSGAEDEELDEDELLTNQAAKAEAGAALVQINDWLARHLRFEAHFAVNVTDDGLTVVLVASNGAEYGEINIPVRVI